MLKIKLFFLDIGAIYRTRSSVQPRRNLSREIIWPKSIVESKIVDHIHARDSLIGKKIAKENLLV